MRQVQQIMSMPISIDIPGSEEPDFFDAVFARLKQIDKRLSTYKQNSEVSRLVRGELKQAQLSEELARVIKGCKKAEADTNGYFSAWYSGIFDPSGYVKGWAIAETGEVIETGGHKTYCISAGGDILASSDSEKVWSIGIQDPSHPGKILNKLSISNGAVCTSGNYERGIHIINPKTKKPAKELLSVTIMGPDIVMADVLATAVFAMGLEGEEFMEHQKTYQALIIRRRNQESSQ
jgi:thiamine biosynthesis lipoprotein